jgi:hypothetical protein
MMVGHVKSARQKKREATELKETWLEGAIEIYHQECQSSAPKSLKAIWVTGVISVTSQKVIMLDNNILH